MASQDLQQCLLDQAEQLAARLGLSLHALKQVKFGQPRGPPRRWQATPRVTPTAGQRPLAAAHLRPPPTASKSVLIANPSSFPPPLAVSISSCSKMQILASMVLSPSIRSFLA